MDVKALMILPIALVLMSNRGCQTLGDETAQQKLVGAARVKAAAESKVDIPEMPEACTAMMGRAKPGGEPWVFTNERWEILADNRDQLTLDCAEWGAGLKAKYGATE